MKEFNALIIGATGATGQEIVSRLLDDDSCNSVTIFVRKDPNISHEKLLTHSIDFSKIEAYKDLIKGDVLFSCLGTTLKEAGLQLSNNIFIGYSYDINTGAIDFGRGSHEILLRFELGSIYNKVWSDRFF